MRGSKQPLVNAKYFQKTIHKGPYGMECRKRVSHARCFEHGKTTVKQKQKSDNRVLRKSKRKERGNYKVECPNKCITSI